jgi:hypothetical protein
MKVHTIPLGSAHTCTYSISVDNIKIYASDNSGERERPFAALYTTRKAFT